MRSRPEFRALFCAAAALTATMALASAAVAAPGTEPPDSETLDGEGRAEVVESVARRVVDHYVFPEVARTIAAELRRKLTAGGYDAFTRPADLASALTGDLQAHDRHFLVDWNPPDSGASPPGSHSEAAQRAWREYSRRHNHGFESVARLPGNIGYLDLRYFDDPGAAGETATAAMAMLALADAVIVDVRQNGGGEPAMVQLLLSYFFDRRIHYNSFYWRSTGATEQFWTLSHVPGRRLPDVPLFVLTSPRTGSAGEGFTYALQALGRAEVVGQATAGAANPGEGFEVGRGFGIFISNGTPINPVTGTNWEREGVQPDVAVSADQALEVARIRALERLLETADDPARRRELEWAADALRATREPVVLEPEALAAYAGCYGARRIRVDGGELSYQRGERPRRAMIPRGGDLFLVEGLDGFRTRFERDAEERVVRLVDMWSDGHVEASPAAPCPAG